MRQPMFIAPCTVVVRHETPVHLRQATPDDMALLTDLLLNLSARTRYLRYLHPLPHPPAQARAEADRMLTHAPQQAMTLIATSAHGDHIAAVAVAELVRDPARATRGEFAVLVRDDVQRRGLGSALSRYVVAQAQTCGLTQVHVDLLPENQAALRLLRHAGRPYTITFASGLMHAVLHLQEATVPASHQHKVAMQLNCTQPHDVC